MRGGVGRVEALAGGSVCAGDAEERTRPPFPPGGVCYRIAAGSVASRTGSGMVQRCSRLGYR